MDAKQRIARRVAQELRDGDIVNLGIGLPTMVANYLPEGIHITLQSENGFLGDAPRDKCTLSCAINGIHAAFHYLKKNYISGCVMTVPTGW